MKEQFVTYWRHAAKADPDHVGCCDNIGIDVHEYRNRKTGKVEKLIGVHGWPADESDAPTPRVITTRQAIDLSYTLLAAVHYVESKEKGFDASQVAEYRGEVVSTSFALPSAPEIVTVDVMDDPSADGRKRLVRLTVEIADVCLPEPTMLSAAMCPEDARAVAGHLLTAAATAE